MAGESAVDHLLEGFLNAGGGVVLGGAFADGEFEDRIDALADAVRGVARRPVLDLAADGGDLGPGQRTDVHAADGRKDTPFEAADHVSGMAAPPGLDVRLIPAPRDRLSLPIAAAVPGDQLATFRSATGSSPFQMRARCASRAARAAASMTAG